MTISIRRKTKNLDKLLKKLQTLSKHKVESGYFKQQGLHHSGYTYPALMSIHEYGKNGNLERPVKFFTTQAISNSKIPFIFSEIHHYFKGNQTTTETLDNVGQIITLTARSFFGSPALEDNAPLTIELKGENSPLIDTGDLRDHWVWKTSIGSGFKSPDSFF